MAGRRAIRLLLIRAGVKDREAGVATEDRSRTSAPDSALDVAKRIYLYGIAAIGLFLLGAGLANLLELAISRIEELWSNARFLVGGEGGVRRQLSVHVAMVLVALPIWLLHWFVIERSASREDNERRSTVRALFLALSLAVPLIYATTSLRDLLNRLFLELSGDDGITFGGREVPEALALVVVAGGILAYHAWVRLRDERVGPLPARANWPPRLYLYAAAFAGAMLMVSGVVTLLGVTVDALFDPGGEIVRGERWWAGDLSRGLANALTGLFVWGAHWGYALRRIAGAGWQGLAERRSTLRRVYLSLAAFTGVVLALATAVRILDALFQTALGVYPDGEQDLAPRLVESALRLAPFGVLWFYHQRQVVAEAVAFAEAPLQAGVRRAYTYGAALIGLLFAGIGLARLVALAVAVLSSGEGQLTNPGDAWRDEASFFAAIAIVGAGAWLRQWYTIQRWLAADPGAEREATTRRVYLFGALGGAVIAALGGLSVIVYRILSTLLDVTGRGDFILDISGPTGVASIALAILAYHGLTLRADLAARPEAGAQPSTRRLVLTGPPGADLDPLIEALKAGLPDGYSLGHDEPLRNR